MARKQTVMWLRVTISGLAVSVLLVAAGFVVYAVEDSRSDWHVTSQHPSSAEASGWGAQSLAVVTQAGKQLQLIPLANACGLGASSCFKCHNGVRADKPASKRWHTQHASVNNSCVGCHDGNPRLLKESMSHRNLVVNPLEKPQKYCFSCHKGNDGQALLAQYMQLAGGEE